jgi:hypothetical protein
MREIHVKFFATSIRRCQPALVEAKWSTRCCAAALGRFRAAVCLRACMHASLLLGCLRWSHSGWGGDRSNEEAERACGVYRPSVLHRSAGNPVVHKGQNNTTLVKKSLSQVSMVSFITLFPILLYYLKWNKTRMKHSLLMESFIPWFYRHLILRLTESW